MRPALLALLVCLASAIAQTPEDRFRKGVSLFFDARIKEALAEWDAQVAADPATLPYHWQRGIALYYADRFADGRAQFESHQKVNSQDVENAVWHYLCVARLESRAAARKALLPTTKDPRIPMKEVHALFAGSGTPEAVTAAATKAGGEAKAYADLYLGLHAEANGDPDTARRHLTAAAAALPKDSYMGEVARVHCRLRKWESTPATPPAAPAKPSPPAIPR
jgi:lipoprotein NlpI